MFGFYVIEYTGAVAGENYGFQVDEGPLPRTVNDAVEQIVQRVQDNGTAFTKKLRVTFVQPKAAPINVTDDVISAIIEGWDFSGDGDMPTNDFLDALEGRKIEFDLEADGWDAHCRAESASRLFL